MKKSEKILKTAAKLWRQNSVKKTTMDEIAADANVSKVTIYKYFSDKESLALAVGKFILEGYAARLLAIEAVEDDLIAKMQQMIAMVSAFAVNGDYALCQELIRYNEVLAVTFDQYLSAYEHTMYQLIDAGIAAGHIRADVNRQMIFYYLDMGIVYYQHSETYRSHLAKDAQFQQQIMQFLMGNIFTEPSVSRKAAQNDSH
jgi:AcrR family transcriptional regulator